MDLKSRMATSTKPLDKKLFASFKYYDAPLAEKMLTHYLSRCKDRHRMAFYQFRKMLPKAKVTCLSETFYSNHERAEKGYATCVKLVKDGKKKITKKELEIAAIDVKKMIWRGMTKKKEHSNKI